MPVRDPIEARARRWWAQRCEVSPRELGDANLDVVALTILLRRERARALREAADAAHQALVEQGWHPHSVQIVADAIRALARRKT